MLVNHARIQSQQNAISLYLSVHHISLDACEQITHHSDSLNIKEPKLNLIFGSLSSRVLIDIAPPLAIRRGGVGEGAGSKSLAHRSMQCVAPYTP